MFQAIHVKLLIAILAALTAIGSWLVYQQNQAAKANEAARQAADAAAKTAALLQQQRDDKDKQEKEYQRFRTAVEAAKKKRNMGFGKESKTWQKYLP